MATEETKQDEDIHSLAAFGEVDSLSTAIESEVKAGKSLKSVINLRDDFRSTPLIEASKYGRTEV